MPASSACCGRRWRRGSCDGCGLRVLATVNEYGLPSFPGSDADTALCLARYFGTTPQFWLNLQTADDLARAEITARPAIERDVHPRAA